MAIKTRLFMPGDTVLEGWQEFGLLVFDEGAEILGLGFLFGYAALTLRHFSGMPALQLLPMVIRHLKILPMSSTRLVGLLVARRLAGWAAVWLVLLALHVVVRGQPASWRLDWLIVAMGADAVLHAAQIRWANRSYQMWVAILLLSPIFRLLIELPLRRFGVDPSLLAVAPIALAVAALVFGALWLHLLITRRSDIFRGTARPA
jgi:hypothetical protein